MLAAKTNLEIRMRGAAALNSNFHELAHRFIESHKGIMVNDPFLGVLT